MKKFILILIAICSLYGCSYQTHSVTNTVSTSSSSELSREVNGWGFVRKKGSAPEITLKQQEELLKYNGYYLGRADEKEIYLTFDEGYENGYTSQILDILKEYSVPAAFFVTGPYLEGQQELVNRMINEGHIVGNHTIHHPNLGECDKEKIETEINGLNTICEEMYGISMKYVRPPEGAYSEYSLWITQQLGYKTILWSHAYKDWDVNYQLGKQNAIDQVVPYFHNGEILLLHAVSKDNASALGDIINAAHAQGYTFKSLDELP